MDHPRKTNLIALISFTCGLLTLLSTGLVFAMYNLLPTSDTNLFITDSILIPVRNISVLAAIITGTLAHWQIKKTGDAEKGKWLAWAGIFMGGAWLLFGICAGLVFLISIIAHLW